MDEVYVYDSLEHRQWGPFVDEDDANAFIESDKYLQSWCVVSGDRRKIPPPATYPPSAYHGSWPQEA